jgi:hypothetical protein
VTGAPPGSVVRARPDGVRIVWRGAGVASALETRELGEGLRIRRAGARTLISARLPAGFELVDAHLIRPGEMRALGDLGAGAAVAVEEAPRVEAGRVPPYVRSLLSGLADGPPAAGLVFGVLRGPGLTGRHVACAVPTSPAP